MQKKISFLYAPFLLALFSILPATAFAGSTDTLTTVQPDTASQPVIPVPPPPAPVVPKVDSIIVTGWKVIGNDHKNASLDDYIKVVVKNLPLLYQQEGHKTDQVVLYIDGVAMHGIIPMFENRKSDSLIFKLVRDSTTAAAWAVFYEYPRPKNGVPMKLSIGWEHDQPVYSNVDDFRMDFVGTYRMWVASGAIAFIILICWLLGMRTNMLRDKVTVEAPAPAPAPAPEGAAVTPPVAIRPKKAPYSLARTQIMFWTVVSAISFIFIWAVTLDIPEITTSTLVLLTVSVATTAGARTVDLSQEDNPARHQNKSSEGFWRDILSDEKGICIHRLQMVLWMLIVGVYFLNVAFTNLYMPQLDNTLLALMGLSAGTYVGMKLPENKGAAPAPNQ